MLKTTALGQQVHLFCHLARSPEEECCAFGDYKGDFCLFDLIGDGLIGECKGDDAIDLIEEELSSTLLLRVELTFNSNLLKRNLICPISSSLLSNLS